MIGAIGKAGTLSKARPDGALHCGPRGGRKIHRKALKSLVWRKENEPRERLFRLLGQEFRRERRQERRFSAGKCERFAGMSAG
jgi:hypothetical protein